MEANMRVIYIRLLLSGALLATLLALGTFTPAHGAVQSDTAARVEAGR
jgi:hypothetical protein